jgi:hypothetical protein
MNKPTYGELNKLLRVRLVVNCVKIMDRRGRLDDEFRTWAMRADPAELINFILSNWRPEDGDIE